MTSLNPEFKNSWHRSKRIKEFLKDLKEAGVEASLKEDSFRDYSLKIKLSTGEELTVYHSPKKNTYKIDLRQVKHSFLLERLKEIWHGESARPGKGYHIYVDGSCLADKIGYGAVVLKDNSPVAHLSGPVDAKTAGNTRQVAGEIEAVIKALEWARDKKISKVSIYYDYEGLRSWALGLWKAKLPLTSSYRDKVASSGIDIKWVKVDAHTGNRWNEEADRLAKKGASKANEFSGQGELF
ncbi:MAG: ribonuclease H [Elusimicrobia bacterium]|nr:ribonuclease H [Elusimicrobiota bacterium]